VRESRRIASRGYEIDAAGIPRVAAGEARKRKPHAAQNAMLAYRD
jgi:hypothetical protein